MTERIDWIVRNTSQVVTLAGPEGPRSGAAQSELGILERAVVLISGDRIAAVGSESDLSRQFEIESARTLDAEGGVVLPGFVDPHTHLLFAGSREGEFEMRCSGKSYMEIAAEGGGIRSSVRSFRAASDEEILAQSRQRLDRMLHQGTTTVEVKSGYALDTEQELRALRLIRKLDTLHLCDLVPTFLGAHEFPDEYREDRDRFVEIVCEEMLPRVAEEKLARFCDVFCEEGVFDVEQSRRILERAQAVGLELKIHADEFAPIGGTELAGELGAVSADHLLVTRPSGRESMKAGGVIAVLLPGTSFSLGKGVYADGRALVDAQIPVALATDCNPGSSMVDSMPLVLALASRENGLSPAEALVSATVNAAYAAGVGEDRGRIEPGLKADLQILAAPSYLTLMYSLGGSHVRWVMKDGTPSIPPRPVAKPRPVT